MEQKKEQVQNELPEHVEIAVCPPNALEAIERADTDMQIATAKKYPRSMKRFLENAIALVTVDEDTAESCIYRRPVGRDASGKMEYAEGESIRLAEIVAATYGNLRVGAIITEITPRYVKARGMAHDLESNYLAAAEVVEATVTKNGQPYSERMRLVTAKVAQSKALRDAIFRAVPKSVCKPIINKCYEIMAGNEKPLSERRAAAAAWIASLPIEPERVFNALEVNGIEDITAAHLVKLTGIKTALKDGDITLDEAFPEIQQETNDNQQTKGAAGLAARLKSSKSSVQKVQEPPKIAKYICKHCDNEFDNPVARANTLYGLCPKCLSDKLVDREAKNEKDKSNKTSN